MVMQASQYAAGLKGYDRRPDALKGQRALWPEYADLFI